MVLTASQQEKMGEAISYLKAGHKRVIITGEAGTGKTFMTNELIYVMKTELYAYGGIHVTAPTHKALEVLVSKIEDKPYIHFNTIHSALKLSRRIDMKTGKEHFKVSDYNPKWPPFKGAQVVILDEASMLARDILFGEGGIQDYPNLTFIFIGDEEQLPPIGEEVSPIFAQGWPTVRLTETIRQKNGNPILDVAKNLSLIKTVTPSINLDNTGFFFEPTLVHIINRLAEVNGTDDMKYMAWTNSNVDAVNAAVRYRIYGTPAKVELGESLIFDGPYGEYKNNEEILVEKLEIVDTPIMVPIKGTKLIYVNGQAEFKEGQDSPMETMIVRAYLINEEILVLHEESEHAFQQKLAEIVRLCSNFQIPWPLKFHFEEQLARINYNHAITVHKSQGSTYGLAIINVGNINFNPRLYEKRKMFYTAITRASQKVCFHNVTPRTLRI